RDVHAALNFGFLDSTYGKPDSNITSLHHDVVLPYPYGGARRLNDGFYNPYAAIFYYRSDAYGHPFSDWLGAASPLFKFTRGDRVRITILPDDRLDAPLVTVSGTAADSISLSFHLSPGQTVTRFPLVPKLPPCNRRAHRGTMRRTAR